MKRLLTFFGILAMPFLLAAAPGTFATSRQSLRSSDGDYSFDADVTRVQMAINYSGPAIIADLDPGFVVTLKNITPVLGRVPVLHAGTLTFAIHSPSMLFRGDHG